MRSRSYWASSTKSMSSPQRTNTFWLLNVGVGGHAWWSIRALCLHWEELPLALEFMHAQNMCLDHSLRLFFRCLLVFLSSARPLPLVLHHSIITLGPCT